VAARTPETAPQAGFPDSSFKYTPLRHVRVMFIRFVQGLFYSAPEGCYHWDEDEQKTELLVTNEQKMDPEVLYKRPAITFTRGPVSFYSMGIDDLLEYEFDIAKKTKGVLIPGTMAINCISRVPQEAEDLAWVVAEHIWLLRDLLMKAGFFEIGKSPQIGSPSPAGSIVAQDQGDEFTVVAVSVPYQFSRTSSLTPLGNRIVEGIEQHLTLNPGPGMAGGRPVVGSTGAAWHPHEIPLTVHVCPAKSFAPGTSGVYSKATRPGVRPQAFLPKQPHPLNPAVTVRVRTVLPRRPGVVPPRRGVIVPIVDPCVEQS
jgi:hypothetical protein